jgi:hypothetical protein
MSNLPITPVIDVNIISSPVALGRLDFNLGLIIGDSLHISTVTRVKIYASTIEMIADGFLITDPEVIAATIYFAQSPKPNNVAIGRFDAATPETIATCLTDCRAKNSDWYACYITEATDANVTDAALVIESLDPASFLFADSNSAAIAAGTALNLAEVLKGHSYQRTLLQYSLSENVGAAIMGYAMGANGFDKPTYTLMFKQEVGITPDSLTTSQVNIIEGNNCNVYVNRGGYSIFEKGVTPSGIFFDEILGLDMLAESIRVNVMNLFTSTLKIPQTDSGVTQIIGVITQPCDEAVTRNFIAPGTWTGAPIGGVATGDTLVLGYAIIADSVADQSDADRAARKAPNISVLVKLAGAIHSAIINVYVNR